MRKNNPTVAFAVALLIFSSIPSAVIAGQEDLLPSALRREYLMTVLVFIGFMGLFFFVVQRQHADVPKKTGKRTGSNTFDLGPHDSARNRRYRTPVKPKAR